MDSHTIAATQGLGTTLSPSSDLRSRRCHERRGIGGLLPAFRLRLAPGSRRRHERRVLGGRKDLFRRHLASPSRRRHGNQRTAMETRPEFQLRDRVERERGRETKRVNRKIIVETDRTNNPTTESGGRFPHANQAYKERTKKEKGVKGAEWEIEWRKKQKGNQISNGGEELNERQRSRPTNYARK
uniref:Uncharacterized protein n=1 Tax=Rosa rugosa TaxID=74645 RepID=J7G0T5_ROSRU|nr:hypothetical protein [Rosa rugosa]